MRKKYNIDKKPDGKGSFHDQVLNLKQYEKEIKKLDKCADCKGDGLTDESRKQEKSLNRRLKKTLKDIKGDLEKTKVK